MAKQTEHNPPREFLYWLQQIGTALLMLVMVVAVILLIVTAVILPAPLFVIMALLMLLLMAPVVMLMTVSPPVTLSDEGLLLRPLIGSNRMISWQDIIRVRAYPLLPAAHQETGRRLLIGRKKYKAAEGIMLTVPGLPFQYRIAGFLAGEHGAPVVAFTNRTHSDYKRLVQRIEHYARHAIEAG